MSDRPSDELRLTRLGHSTLRIELDGTVLMTDPVLRRRVMHLQRAAPVAPELYEGVDAVLISHAHYDHLDVPSLRKIGRAARMILPRGGRGFLRRRAFGDAVQLSEDEETTIGEVRVRAVFADHPNMRASPIALSPALGYVVSGSHSVYFAGDTDLFPEMGRLAPDLDVALLPVAGWGDSLGAGHLGPFEAAQAAAILRPRVAIPIHWGTYTPMHRQKAAGARDDPATEFVRHASDLAPDVDVRVLELGESTVMQSTITR